MCSLSFRVHVYVCKFLWVSSFLSTRFLLVFFLPSPSFSLFPRDFFSISFLSFSSFFSLFFVSLAPHCLTFQITSDLLLLFVVRTGVVSTHITWGTPVVQDLHHNARETTVADFLPTHSKILRKQILEALWPDIGERGVDYRPLPGFRDSDILNS